MKLGLGIITIPRRIAELPADIKTSPETEVFVHNDTELRGVAYSRNECIKKLYDAGCDYIALCDDDMIYLKQNWFEDVVAVMDKHRRPYCCFPDTMGGGRTDLEGGIESWAQYIGAFYILHRDVIDEVGYFSPAFKGYGFEDVHYKYRLEKCYGWHTNPKILPYVLASEDVLGSNRRPSIDNKEEQIKINRPIFEQEVKNGIRYYPYPDSQ